MVGGWGGGSKFAKLEKVCKVCKKSLQKSLQSLQTLQTFGPNNFGKKVSVPKKSYSAKSLLKFVKVCWISAL